MKNNWYGLTLERFAVIRMVSVPKVEIENRCSIDMITCGVETLSWYDSTEDDLGTMSEITVKRKDIPLFSEGDVLLIKLLRWSRMDGASGYCIEDCIADDMDAPMYAPFVDNRLVITESLKKSEYWNYFLAYNAQIEQCKAATREGTPVYMEFDLVCFEEGMTPEEMAQFFISLKKAKKRYEEFSKTI